MSANNSLSVPTSQFIPFNNGPYQRNGDTASTAPAQPVRRTESQSDDIDDDDLATKIGKTIDDILSAIGTDGISMKDAESILNYIECYVDKSLNSIDDFDLDLALEYIIAASKLSRALYWRAYREEAKDSPRISNAVITKITNLEHSRITVSRIELFVLSRHAIDCNISCKASLSSLQSVFEELLFEEHGMLEKAAECIRKGYLLDAELMISHIIKFNKRTLTANDLFEYFDRR